jgi:hypothetical protein
MSAFAVIDVLAGQWPVAESTSHLMAYAADHSTVDSYMQRQIV